jgi:hypothetical protein
LKNPGAPHDSPTSDQVLETRGAFREHPSRRRGPTPVVEEGLGKPPEGLSAAEREACQEIARGAPEGVLTRADRLSVELAARLLAELRAGSATMQTSRIAQLRFLLSGFGMLPADRANVSVPAKPKRSRLREALGDEEYFRLTGRR